MSLLPLLVIGTITEVSVMDPEAVLPRTQVTLVTAAGQAVTFVVPGTNGAPPLQVGGVPALHPGETWLVELAEAPVGLVPVGLGAGLVRLDAPLPPPPPWNLNGLTYRAEDLPLEVYLHDAGSVDLGLEATEAVVQRALGAWSQVGCASFAFSYAGTTTAGFEDDGLNVLSWEDEEWVWGGSVAGLSATRFGTNDVGEVIPLGADIVFNGVDWAWTTDLGDVYSSPARLNADSIVLHELGHVTGMDHEMVLVASTMFFAYIGGDWQGSLSGDDRRGLCENYPTGQEECVQDQDCMGLDNQLRTCVSLAGVAVCDEVRDPVGAFCARTHFNCAEYCAFTNRSATEGYCTLGCTDTTDCPEGYRCGTVDLFLYDDPDLVEQLCIPEEADTGDTAATSDSRPPEPTPHTPRQGGCAHRPASGRRVAGWWVWASGGLVLSLRRRKRRGQRTRHHEEETLR